MAIFHMGEIKIVTRGKGRSAVSHAAYQSGISMTNQWDGWEQKNVTKQEVMLHEVLLPENAPEEFKDAETLWNSIEQYEKSINAQLARYFDVEFQDEFSDQENINLLREFCNLNFVEEGMCCQIDAHKKSNGRTHAHVQLTMRQLDQDGHWTAKSKKAYLCKLNGVTRYMTADEFKRYKEAGWEKMYRYSNGSETVSMTKSEAKIKPEYERLGKDPVAGKKDLTESWNDPENAVKWRESWADLNNRLFEEKGMDLRISHLSNEDQDLDELPHVSYSRIEWQKKQRGERIEGKDEYNAAVDAYNGQIREIKAEVELIIAQTESDLNWVRSLSHPDENTEDLNEVEADLVQNEKIMNDIINSGLFSKTWIDHVSERFEKVKTGLKKVLDIVWDRIQNMFRTESKAAQNQKPSLLEKLKKAEKDLQNTKKGLDLNKNKNQKDLDGR